MNENKFSVLCRQAVRVIGIIMMGYLFLQGLFTICCIQEVKELTFYIQNNVPRQIVGIVLFGVLIRLLWTRKVQDVLNKYGTPLVIIMLMGVVAFLAFWVYKTQFWYVSDMELIYIYAEKLVAGDYSGWQPGGYPYMNPHQNGLILLVALLQTFLSQRGTFNALYIMNIILYGATIISLFFCLRQIYKDKAVYSVQTILMLCFIPYSFFCLMMYGNVMSFGWACISVALCMWYCKDYKLIKVIGSGICMILAIALKQNQLLVFVALLIFLAFEWLNSKGNKRKLTLGIMVYTVIVLIGLQLPDWTIEQITGIEEAPGNSKWSYIAMGLMEEGTSPGWYNGYNGEVFERNNYDHDATAAEALDKIADILQGFAEDPASGWRFFHYKLASEWNNPTFECFNVQNARNTALELPSYVKSTINDGGKINLIFIYLFDLFQIAIMFGILIYLIADRDAGWDKLLFVILFIGGFLFYTAYEAKAQYVVYYFLTLIPYGLLGYLEIFKAGIPKWNYVAKEDLNKEVPGKRFRITGWNRVHTGIVIIALLAIIIGVLDNEWINNCFKIYVDTEAYYEYIHLYNQNFLNLRF